MLVHNNGSNATDLLFSIINNDAGAIIVDSTFIYTLYSNIGSKQ
jgi:hypothetical protein